MRTKLVFCFVGLLLSMSCSGPEGQGEPDATGVGDFDAGGFAEIPPLEAVGPRVRLDSLLDVAEKDYLVKGQMLAGRTGSVPKQASLAVNGQASQPLALGPDGAFELPVVLSPGRNSLEIAGTDEAGDSSLSGFMVRVGGGEGSSGYLIEEARKKGILSPSQALRFRVYAAFNPAKLPEEYRGDGSRNEDVHVLDDLAEAGPTLTEEEKAELGAYLVPPIYHPASFLGGTDDSGGGAGGGVYACNPWLHPGDCPVSSDWVALDGNSIRVWYAKNAAATDVAMAKVVLGVLEGEKCMARLRSLMNATHAPDDGGPYSGGDKRLDVILADIQYPGYTRTHAVMASGRESVFIVLNRKESVTMLESTAVHEYMHAIQYNLPLKAYPLMGPYHTLAEATAVWASHWCLSRKGNTAHHGYNLYFFKNPETGLFRFPRINPDRTYTAWLFFLFLEMHIGKEIVREVWGLAAGADEQSALVSAVASHGKRIDELWPRFALSAWNRDPVADLRKWDAIQGGASAVGQVQLPVDAPPHVNWDDLSYGELPFLSVMYRPYRFGDPAVRSMVVLNGHTRRLKTGAGGLPVQAPVVAPLSDPASAKGAAFWAIEKTAGTWKQPEDWSSVDYRAYCRDAPAEKVEELVLVASFSDPDRRSHLYKPEQLAPKVMWSNVFCEAAQGSASITFKHPATAVVTMNGQKYAWKRSGVYTAPANPGPGTVVYGFTLELTGGTVSWSASGKNSSGCTVTGSLQNAPVTAYEGNRLHLLSFAVGPEPRLFFLRGVGTEKGFEEEWSCTGSKPKVPFISPVLWQPHDPFSRYLVQQSGRRIEGDGTHFLSPGFISITGTWSVESSLP